MRTNKYKGLTDAEVTESRARYGANVLSPAEPVSFWGHLKNVCCHPLSVAMAVLVVLTTAFAALLAASAGTMIWVMPAACATSALLILLVGFFGGYADPLFRILITAFVLSMGISVYEFEWHGEGWTVFFEPIGIIVALILATGIAYYLERKNEKTFQSLNQTNDDTLVKTYRNGRLCEVMRKDIVTGDIVRLDTGEEVPADCVLLEAASLTVDESSLTGEPLARKTTVEDEFDCDATYRSNEIKKGTTVIEGHCVARVTEVGDMTESGAVYRSLTVGGENRVGWLLRDEGNGTVIGKYSTEGEAREAQKAYVEEHEEADVVVEQPLVDRMRVRQGSETPLSRKLNVLAKWITRASYAVAALVVVGRITWYCITAEAVSGSPEAWMNLVSYVLKTVMIAVTLIVVAVPEGLPMSVTLSLAFSMRKLMKTGTLPRTMHACETMGAASVICTDKTGTLTKNQMEVADCRLADVDADLLAEMIALNSTADLDTTTNETKVIGNPTEGALLMWLGGKGYDYLSMREAADITDSLPFSTENKYMATAVASAVTGKRMLYVKGAPEILLGMSGISKAERSAYEETLAGYQSRAMRTLALAYAELDENETENSFEQRLVKKAGTLTFAGVFALHDDIREGVSESIADCMRAGIAVKIVTGDTPGTAVEIGRKIGLWTDADTDRNIITGDELAALSDSELAVRAMDIKIIARARPMDKKRLVEALRHCGQVVAVTGDGTNDAPALNAADVGLAMGNGTAVAKDASDMIIRDNSFSTIANAVMWGRSLFKNIQRFLLFQLTVNVAACLLVLCGAFMGTESPLTVTQMLWVNLIMDTFAAIALSALPPQRSVMNEPPRSQQAFILDRAMLRNIFGVGGFFFVLTFAMLIVFQHADITDIRQLAGVSPGGRSEVTVYELTLLFTVFVITHMGYMFNARAYNTGGSGWNLKGCDGFLLIATVVTLGQVAIVQLPVLNQFFNVSPLRLSDWAVILILGFLVSAVREVYSKIKKS